jgi:putative nucleotidyltransferase with HDIG domain
MKRIHIVTSCPAELAALKSTLSGHFEADYLTIGDLPRHMPAELTVLDLSLRQADELQMVKKWLSRRAAGGQVVVAVEDKSSRLQLAQACAIGATAVLQRPITPETLYRTLFRVDDVTPLAPLLEEASDLSCEFKGLQDVFAAAASGQKPDLLATKLIGAQIVEKIASIGIADYLSIVRSHHAGTYQHCLCVTAVAVAFAFQLGFHRSDTEKVALAGLLHDIGKAGIPLKILEKPSELTKEETITMRQHPLFGHEILRDMPGLSDDILDMVLHHHEYLDGSGYPHGLKGDQISDLCRFITIADVFGALIERRAYKPPLPGGQAFRILQAMGPKLDLALVREFAPLSRAL